MRRLTALVVVCVLLITGFAAAAPTRSDAVVVVLVRGLGAKRAGTAFFIGDGSLAVTARHVIYGNTHNGDGESMGMVSLISPYLGDECEAQIVAEDRDLDLAIVRGRWKGHPAVELADEQATMAATALEVESQVATVRALMDLQIGSAGLNTQTEQLPVDYVGMRAGQSRIVTFNTVGKLSPGWSGSAAFVPGTSKVAGCLSTIGGVGGIVGVDATCACAFSAEQVRTAVKREGLSDALQPHETMVRPGDAEAVFKLIVQCFAERSAEKSAELAKQLIAKRPDNAACQVMATAGQYALHRLSEAEACYRKAMELDPRSVEAHVFYAQFLAEQKRPKEAMALLEEVRRDNPRSTIWAIGMCNILNAQSSYAASVKVLEEALAVTPRDPGLLAYLGQAQKETGDHAGAVKSLRRALELGLEIPGLRAVLIGQLEETGSLDEAEAQCRLLKDKTPSDPKAHFLLANFLANHRPAKQDEAIAELEQALALPGANSGPLGSAMRDLLQRLKKHATTEPTLHL